MLDSIALSVGYWSSIRNGHDCSSCADQAAPSCLRSLHSAESKHSCQPTQCRCECFACLAFKPALPFCLLQLCLLCPVGRDYKYSRIASGLYCIMLLCMCYEALSPSIKSFFQSNDSTLLLVLRMRIGKMFHLGLCRRWA